MYRMTTPSETVARQAAKQMQERPDTVPVVVEPDVMFYARLGDHAEDARRVLEHKRFAPNKDWTAGQFLCALRKRIRLSPQYACFLLVSPKLGDHVLPIVSSKMADVHRDFHDPNTGMLWATLAVESCFGAGQSTI